MERTVNKTTSFAAAREWEIEQEVAMTPLERLRAARALKQRVYPAASPDVRECHRRG